MDKGCFSYSSRKQRHDEKSLEKLPFEGGGGQDEGGAVKMRDGGTGRMRVEGGGEDEGWGAGRMRDGGGG